MIPASLDNPVEIALIGTGNRSQTVYRPLFAYLHPWLRLVAVCDPVRDHADAYAASLGVPAFYSLQELVKARPMEAALVVTPIESHHAISCYLSQHGIHHHVETMMCNLVAQGQEMVQTARDHGVVLRIAENFFRFPLDRIAKKVVATGFLGEVRRLICHNDSLGFHNNSRWLHFFGAHPTAVQAISHTMPTAPHYEAPHRFHTQEGYSASFFFFPEGCLAVDGGGNVKSLLGRYPRPGYVEFDGERGTLVQESPYRHSPHAEVRHCSDAALQNGARADGVFPIVHRVEEGSWHSTYIDLPLGRIEHINPYRVAERTDPFASPPVIDHLVDFACAVRGVRQSEYTAEDALMALMMVMGTRESALRAGTRLALPLTGDLEAEQRTRKGLHEKFGVDPLDLEGMLALTYPRL
jgi:predicted dehydrogenase